MKVGIVSQYGHDNFGNKLQNYALQQVLLQYADEVITLRNEPKACNIWEYLRWYSDVSESAAVSMLLGKKKRAAFLNFQRRYLQTSKGIYPLNGEAVKLRKKDRCDLYCAGSDQVWKPGSGRAGSFQLLEFARKDQCFSYAASFGVDRLPQEVTEQMRQGLSRFQYISVREESGKKIAESLTGRQNIPVLPDPTLLLPREKWGEIARKPAFSLPERYLLTYFLGSVTPERRKKLKEKVLQMGCTIVDPETLPAGPEEFLYLIQNALLVCTDSFHGSIFAVIFRRPLLIFPRRGGECMHGRLETLAATLKLQNCLLREDCIPAHLPEYPDPEDILAAERKRAHAYLEQVFRDAERNL